MQHRQRLLFACFMTLIAAGVGFAVRSGVLGEWERMFGFSKTEMGTVTGMGFVGFGIVIILSSFITDRVGYKTLLVLAFLLHLISFIGTAAAAGVYAEHGKEATYQLLKWSMFLFAVANGFCEAVINPLVATLYPDRKTHYLNILHAGWPGGIVVGGVLAWCFVGEGAALTHLRWEIPMAFFILPTLIYGWLVIREEFPVSEARAAGLSYSRMLAAFASPMLVMLLVLHACIGYVELGTDSWIANIMENVSSFKGILFLVYTAGLMFVLRFFAGPIVERINPLGLLLTSSVIACIGLYGLGSSTGGTLIFVALTLYGIGKTFLWPTMLGVVGERFPHGGALTMGMIGGVGMLSAGLLGGPGIGYTQDLRASQHLVAESPEAYERVRVENPRRFLLFDEVYGLDATRIESLDPDDPDVALAQAAAFDGGRSALRTTAVIPALMAIGYLLLLLWFRSRGGYKPIQLKESPAGADAEQSSH